MNLLMVSPIILVELGEWAKPDRSEIIKTKESVLNKLTSTDYTPDSDKLKSVDKAFDRMLMQIGPGRVTKEDKGFLSRFKKKKEDTTKDYSILDLINMFINKKDIKIWF